MFSFLKKSPPPDAVQLKAVAGRIVNGLLAAVPEVTKDHIESQGEGFVINAPSYMPATFNTEKYAERVPPSTLHHWALSTSLQLTTLEAAMEKHIAAAVNDGYHGFQSRISNVNTLTEPGELRHISGDRWQFSLPLKTLHSPENFVALIRKSSEAFHNSVEHRATIASMPHRNAGRTGGQQAQRQ